MAARFRGARSPSRGRSVRARTATRVLRALLAVALPAVLVPPLVAQEDAVASRDEVRAQGDSAPAPTDASAVPVPFGPGERLRYRVKFGFKTVGESHLAVTDIDTVAGHQTYRLEMALEGSVFFGALKVDDLYESWLDTDQLVSRRFIRDIHQVNYRSRREFAIYPEEQRWERLDEDKSGKTGSIFPLDEISFIYYLRTLPLKVGETYTLQRYFKEDGNPVTVKVLRKEEIEVDAGTFQTIVVQPIIQTDGLFSEGGRAEVYLSDDEHRHVVYLRSEISSIGSLTLHLKEIIEGVPLNPEAR